MTSSSTSSSSSNFFPARCFFRWRNKWNCFISSHNGVQKPGVHLFRWETIWRNAPRIWRDFGSALPFQTRLTQTKSVLPLPNEHGSQVKDQGRRRCCHNKHTNFPYRPTRDTDAPRIMLVSFEVLWLLSQVMHSALSCTQHSDTNIWLLVSTKMNTWHSRPTQSLQAMSQFRDNLWFMYRRI